MKRLVAASLLLVSFACVAAGFRYDIRSDHANALYDCGEMATFTVKVLQNDGTPAKVGKVRAVLDNFGPKKVAEAEWNLSSGESFAISGTLGEPGFLRLRLTAPETPEVSWGVGFEPQKIRKGSPLPKDFDAFWNNAVAKLEREVPLDARVVRVPERSTKDFDFFRISFATFGRRIYGYMSVPTNKAKAPYPVEIEVNAAGFGGYTNDMEGSADAICVRFSVYPFDMDWRWKEMGLERKYNEMNAAYWKKYGTEYSQAGLSESREAYFFYPVILGINRAVDWVAAQPNVDLTQFRYQGTSQGGGFGFYLAGLNRHFTKVVAFVPACTDTMGYLAGRQSGWPRPVESQPTPEARAAAARNAPYFDAANFAACPERIVCPIRVVVGFADTCCAPCAVYSAYNALGGMSWPKDRRIEHGIGMSHSVRWEYYQKYMPWLRTKERLYDEDERPQLRFTSARGWMNDPNGLSYYNGEWHLFYQHNPFAFDWRGSFGCEEWLWKVRFWGHAVSKDLVHWREIGDAVSPGKLGYPWSGSAVVDRDGVAGFGKNAHILFYTAAPKDDIGRCTQCMAWSLDGRSYAEYEGNPVIGQIAFETRDPKVFWHKPTKRWVMALFVEGRENRMQNTIRFYTSVDLKKWELASVLKGGVRKEGDYDNGMFLWECPGLEEVPVEGTTEKRWVVWGASGEYAVGDFDGRAFTIAEGPFVPLFKQLEWPSWKPYYAAQTFFGAPDGRVIWMAWLKTDTDRKTFNQSLSLPVELKLKRTDQGLRLAYYPVKELESLRVGGPVPMEQFEGELAEIWFAAKPAKDAKLIFDLRGVPLTYDAATETLTANGQSGRWPLRNGRFEIRIFFDRFGMEMYAPDGLDLFPVSHTMPHRDKTRFTLKTKGKVEGIESKVWKLNSAVMGY